MASHPSLAIPASWKDTLPESSPQDAQAVEEEALFEGLFEDSRDDLEVPSGQPEPSGKTPDVGDHDIGHQLQAGFQTAIVVADTPEVVNGAHDALRQAGEFATHMANQAAQGANPEEMLKDFGKKLTVVQKDETPLDLAVLQKAITEGFDCRGALGQKMSRDKPAMIEMKNKSTHTEKAAFRKEWAARQYTNLQETKYKHTQYQVIDVRKGEYVSLPLLVERFGGPAGMSNPIALRAALTYATKCYILACPWVCYNEMAELDEYLHFRKQHREVFSQVWGLRSTQQSNSSARAAVPAAFAPSPVCEIQTPANDGIEMKEPESAPKLCASKRRKAVHAGDKEANAGGKGDSTPTGKQKDPLTGAFALAGKLKVRYGAKAESLKLSLAIVVLGRGLQADRILRRGPPEAHQVHDWILPGVHDEGHQVLEGRDGGRRLAGQPPPHGEGYGAARQGARQRVQTAARFGAGHGQGQQCIVVCCTAVYVHTRLERL